MLIQLTTPRPIFDASKLPPYVQIFTLGKTGVSKGEVYFSAVTDPEYGTKERKALEPANAYVTESVTAFEYVLPFWEILPQPSTRAIVPAGADRVAVGGVHLARYFTAGFAVVAKSAFPASSTEYVERTVGFTILCPVTGGGVIRMSDAGWDIANGTFDPYAPSLAPPRDEGLLIAFRRTHEGRGGGRVDAVRAARIAAAEASMAKAQLPAASDEKVLPSESERKMLPPGSYGE